ncbi:MAG TPA: hypothetical protein VHH36_02720 [Candidatus Thermoplasmatota archaeon]|nr:hypothetical protein [Candidatus Thermoplasmatota archaeon]
MRPLLLFAAAGSLLSGIALAGCADDASPATDSRGNAVAVVRQPVRHAVVSHENLAVSAGSSLTYGPIVLPEAGVIEYSWGATDNSRGLDSIVIRSADGAEFRDGDSVSGWGYQRYVRSATERVSLSAGEYAVGFRCHNDVADCDIQLSVDAIY